MRKALVAVAVVRQVPGCVCGCAGGQTVIRPSPLLATVPRAQAKQDGLTGLVSLATGHR